MGLNLNRDRLCLIQISNGDGNAYLVQFDKNNYNAPNLKKILLDDSRCKIFHFARFDLAVIKKYLNIELSNIFCTKIASKLVRTYTEHHGLKDLCKELLGVNMSKHQQSSYWGTSSLTEEQKDYAARDVLYLHSLKMALQQMLVAENRDLIAQKLCNFLPTIANLDLMGWNDLDIFSHGFSK